MTFVKRLEKDDDRKEMLACPNAPTACVYNHKGPCGGAHALAVNVIVGHSHPIQCLQSPLKLPVTATWNYQDGLYL